MNGTENIFAELNIKKEIRSRHIFFMKISFYA